MIRPSCPRCGGSGRNYVDGWACAAHAEFGSRASVCPVCYGFALANSQCEKKRALVAAFWEGGLVGLKSFAAPTCRCDDCVDYGVEEMP